MIFGQCDVLFNYFSDNVNVTLKISIKPNEIVTLYVHFSPLQKGKTHCDIVLSVVNNPFEKYTVILKMLE